jgi:hypothetical protein
MEEIKPGYTRVTDILSIFQNYTQVDRARLKKAQDIGTLVHAAIEKHFKGEFVPLFMPLTPYFLSFTKWESTLGIKPLIVEERFYDDDLMITGRVDLMAEIEGSLALVDFKTGSWAHPDIWALQASFYRHFLWKMERAPNHFFFVQLRSDGGKPDVHYMSYNPDWWDICKAAIQCYNYFKEKPLAETRGNDPNMEQSLCKTSLSEF